MAIVDTSTIIDAGKNSPKALERVKEVGEGGEELCISSISVFELSSGRPGGLDSARKKLISSMKLIPFNPNHAEKAGETYRQLCDLGQDIGAIDCMIAATAICEKQALITRNAKHFQRIPGLKVITY